MKVFIKRINPNRNLCDTMVCAAILRKDTGAPKSLKLKQVELYPDLKTFLEEHWRPHYNVSVDDEQVKLTIDLFDTHELPGAFTIKNGTVSVVTDYAIRCMNERVNEILVETHHKGMIHDVLSRYVGAIADPKTMAEVSDRISMLLRESLLVRHGNQDRAIIDLISSITGIV